MPMLLNNKTFYALDLDRCLANTNVIFGLFERIVHEETTLGQGALREARDETERTGGSFDVTIYLQESNQHDVLEKVQTRFMKESQQHELFEPGAKELLQFLTDQSLPFGVLTYGGKVWQGMKLRAMGLDTVPHIITDIREKGRFIASWKQGDAFLVPSELGGGTFTNVVLVDDKIASFNGLPKGAYGIHVFVKDSPYSLGDVPADVTQVYSMTEAEALIKSSISV